MERKTETSRKVSPMTKTLRCITNLNEPPINPLKKKRLSRKNDFTRFLVPNDSENKSAIKSPDLQNNKANITTGPSYSPFKSRTRHQTVRELIQNKENYDRNEIIPRTERKYTLPARNVTQRRSPLTFRGEVTNIRRIMDQSRQSPREKLCETLSSSNMVKHSEYDSYVTDESRYRCLINPNYEPGVEELEDNYDESLYEEHSHNKTINEIPHFDEYFQLGRKSAIGRLTNGCSDIFLLRPTVSMPLVSEDSCNRSYYAAQNATNLQLKNDNQDEKLLLKNKRFLDLDESCEFILLDRHGEMLMDIVQNNDLLNHLCGFFGFRELSSFWMCSKKIYEKSRIFKKHLRNLVMNVGISSELRPSYWLYMSKANKLQNEYKPSYYYDLTFAVCPWEKEIKKDIDRTFISNKFFKEKQGQLRLYRVLRAFATHYKNIGYIQGVNYIAATLLTLYNESDSFFILAALFENSDLKAIYDSNMEGLRIYVQMFDYLMDLYFPDLYEYLESQDINSMNYFIQWISTLFSYDLSREMVFKIWDLFLIDGWKVIYKIALAIMKSKRQKIYKVPPEKLMAFLRQIHKASDFDVDKLIASTAEIEISNRLLKDLKEKICSGVKLKKIRLRFDIKKGKRFWEFLEASPPKAIAQTKDWNKAKAQSKSVSEHTEDSKNKGSIFSVFFGAIKSQFDFAQKPKKVKNNAAASDHENEKPFNKQNTSIVTPKHQDRPKIETKLPHLELSKINYVVNSLNFESLEEQDLKAFSKKMAQTPQHRENNNFLFEKSISQRALTSRNAPPITFV